MSAEKIKDTIWLNQVIVDLRAQTATGPLTLPVIERAQGSLAGHGYEYDEEKFPTLAHPLTLPVDDNASPATLSELLLWKIGKWRAYKEFEEFFSSDETIPRNESPVFDAFALHLKNPDESPIFDQHSLRGLWAIASGLTPDEITDCRRYLMSEEQWRAYGYGDTAQACFNLFKHQMDTMTSPSVSQKHVDRLLMPLGQAIKALVPSYRLFCDLCSYPYVTLSPTQSRKAKNGTPVPADVPS